MNSTGTNISSSEKVQRLSAAIAHGKIPAWKRSLDCTLVVLTSPIWLPIAAVVAVWVKMVSPGPALFRQERIGHMGGRFRILKFRTMKVNADTTVHREHLSKLMSSNQPMRKLDSTGDSRLIPGGLWLRTLGVDELPQLINVLRGEMSLVGPRPTTAYEYEMFQPHYRQRCQTLPGLTGLWQVNGKNRTTFEKMMELDLTYVAKKTLIMDIKILAGTAPAILLQLWDVKVVGRKMAQIPAPAKSPAPRPVDNVYRGSMLVITSKETARLPMLAAGARRSGIQAAPEPMDS
jgi:lipopolysaccharide/colanic/teichoic acid biosynthesis glycosyltransferase